LICDITYTGAQFDDEIGGAQVSPQDNTTLPSLSKEGKSIFYGTLG